MCVSLFLGQFTFLIAWVFLAWRLDVHGRRQRPERAFDAIIVPGCAVRWDGQPSGALARRTRHAIDLYTAGVAPRLIFTGGTGTHPPAEAEVSKKMALEAGISQDSILTETHSTTTAENAAFAAQVHPEATGWSVLIVTDGYHCWRCRKLFSAHFQFVDCEGSTPGPRLRVRGAMREVISIFRMLSFRPSKA